MICKDMVINMEILTTKDGETLTLKVIGSLDTLTSNELEAELKKTDGDVKILILDFSQLDYITSVGIRILLSTKKMMDKQGQLILRSLGEEVREVLDITGVLEYFSVE